jgi:hypothetical protein
MSGMAIMHWAHDVDERTLRGMTTTVPSRSAIAISLTIGLVMLAFGLLKLIDPFASWYSVQISASGLPAWSRPLGMTTEVLTGALFVGAWLVRGQLAGRLAAVWTLASLMLVSTMLVATYVHLHPDVPSKVLPLGIKPPVVPLSMLSTAVVNMSILRRSRSRDRLAEA